MVHFLYIIFTLLAQVRIPGPGGAGVASGPIPALISTVCGPATPTSNGGASAAINTTGANLLIITASMAGGATPTFSDSQGASSNTWASNKDPFSGGLFIAYAQNPAHVGAGHTFSVTGAGIFPGFCVYTFSNMLTSGVYESSSWANSGSQPGSITPGSGNQVFVSTIFINGSPSTNTVNSGFSSPVSQPFNGSSNYGNGAAYLIQSGNASQNPSWTATGGLGNVGMSVFQGM